MDFLHECAGFVFDMDGLLLDTERLSRRALHAAAAELEIVLPDDAFFELIGRPGKEIHRRLALRVGEEAAARLDVRSESFYQLYLAEGVPVKEGAAELLEWLAASGRPCAVATSTRTTKAERKLAAAGLRRHFHAVVGGDQVAHGKPAPDIYLAAAAALGLAPQRCGVFEDSEPGVQAAHAAGARVVWVPDLARVGPEVRKLAHAQAGSLRHVLEFLRNQAL
jgi:HAD superfamily hydrolase (TIGR01509 family)